MQRHDGETGAVDRSCQETEGADLSQLLIMLVETWCLMIFMFLFDVDKAGLTVSRALVT